MLPGSIFSSKPGKTHVSGCKFLFCLSRYGVQLFEFVGIIRILIVFYVYICTYLGGFKDSLFSPLLPKMIRFDT